MPELSRFEAQANAAAHMAAQRKSSNMSTNSDDSLRKISNDSGIGIPCSQGVAASARLPSNYEELMGDPRLSADLSTAMLLAQQQSLSALNPAMLGLMSAGLGGLFANPLATAMLQREATARRLLETNGAGKPPMMAPGAGKGHSREQLSMYPGIAGFMQQPNQVADQLALSEALRSQLLNRKFSEELNGGGVVGRPTRKANSFSGTSSSPLHRQFSPPTSNAASPNQGHHLSPNSRNITANSGDEQQTSPYRDDDSIESSKSSAGSHTPTSQPLDSHASMAAYTDVGTSSTFLNSHQFQPSSRKRKNGIIGSIQMSDLNSYSLGAFPSQPISNDIPMHKLSTASLPASLPSNSPLVHDPLSNHCSPATSKKRQRNIQVEEPVGSRREDESYWERRRKNNEAAKRSRDSRRAKEDEIAIKAAFLEQENFKLRLELNKLKEEFSKLQTEIDNRRKPEEKSATEPSKTERDTTVPIVTKENTTTEESPSASVTLTPEAS